MSRRRERDVDGSPRRRAPLFGVLVGCLAVMVVSPQSPGTLALLNARTGNPGQRFATAALYAPSALTASAAGSNVVLSWTAGQNGSGYGVTGVSNGTSSSCGTGSYGTLGSSSSTSYTDTGRSSPAGIWWCYRVTTTYGVWTSMNANPTAATRIGFFVDTAVLSNGGGVLSLDTGDQLVLTYNQAVDTASGPASTDTVCATAVGSIQIGSSTTSGVCGAGEVLSVGTLTGSTVLSNGRWNAGYTWSAGNKVLTIVVGARTSGLLATTITGTSWTFNPTTRSTKSLSATGAQHVCDTTAGGGTCLPTASGTLT